MNKDKIIKDLKERNDKLANQRRQFEFNYYYEQDKVEKKDKEIERLNNIITELEKWSEEYRFANILKDKLKELKGSDK